VDSMVCYMVVTGGAEAMQVALIAWKEGY
jgi:hypothetical protein